MKKPFEVGDRVRVYGDVHGAPEVCGMQNGDKFTVRTIQKDTGYLYVLSDRDPEAHGYVNPKQCRRLVKKPRRRVWIYADNFDDVQRVGSGPEDSFECLRENPMVFTRKAKDASPKLIEFIEVRKATK